MENSQLYPEFTGTRCQPYVINPTNAEVINLGIKLQKPLVIEGEPGCGKTRLAYAIADEFGIPIKVIPVKSSSKATDLLYRFDALRRLQDSQTHNSKKLEQAEYAHNYIHLEYLGRAIYKGERCVVLIDEVDKADIDFPDDLLHVLSDYAFPVLEIPEDESDIAKARGKYGSFVKGPPDGVKPIVIFTSNRSKSLSNPFLRRCFHLDLGFPDNPDVLAKIVKGNLQERQKTPQNLESISSSLITAAIDSFLEIRTQARLNSVTKIPATAELIDWVHVLHIHSVEEDSLGVGTPPFWTLLFKISEDRERYRQATSG